MLLYVTVIFKIFPNFRIRNIIYRQFSSVQSLSRVRLFVTPWIAARQASLSITNSRSSLKLMSIELVMPSSHLILCHPLLLLPPIPSSIRVLSNESTLFSSIFFFPMSDWRVFSSVGSNIQYLTVPVKVIQIWPFPFFQELISNQYESIKKTEMINFYFSEYSDFKPTTIGLTIII